MIDMSRVWQMSLVPLMFRDWWDEFDRPSRLLDQHFGLGLRHHDLLHPGSLLRTGYIRPWRNITRQDSGSSSITADKDKFQVNGLSVSSQFIQCILVDCRVSECIDGWWLDEYMRAWIDKQKNACMLNEEINVWVDDPVFCQTFTACVFYIHVKWLKSFHQQNFTSLSWSSSTIRCRGHKQNTALY
jgi:hypothetical protein